jgi:hypothetical protein
VVGGYSQQPGRQLGFAAKRLDALENGYEDLLGDVLGFGSRAHHAQDQVENTVAVEADDLVEGVFIPLDQSGNQQSFGEAHLKGRAWPLAANKARLAGVGSRERGRRRAREKSLHISIDSVAEEKFRKVAPV